MARARPIPRILLGCGKHDYRACSAIPEGMMRASDRFETPAFPFQPLPDVTARREHSASVDTRLDADAHAFASIASPNLFDFGKPAGSNLPAWARSPTQSRSSSSVRV